MICHACGDDVDPYAQTSIGDGGLRQLWRCPACHTQLPAPDTAAPIDAIAPVVAPKPAAPQPPARPAAKPASRQSPDQPLDILKAARARLRWLKQELKRAETYQREADSITRLLAAASTHQAQRAPKG